MATFAAVPMTIQYHGDACVRLSGKTAAGEFTVLCDPYDAKATGLKVLRPSTVHLVCSTVGALPAFAAGPLLVTAPGEYEAAGVMVKGIAVGDRIVYRMDAEGLHLAHLGNLAKPLDEAALEALGDIDILMIPVGGHGVLTAAQATEVMERMEPRVVIPIQYRLAGATLSYDGPEAFCKAVGCSPTATEEKLRVTKHELPTEDVWVKLLRVS